MRSNNLAAPAPASCSPAASFAATWPTSSSPGSRSRSRSRRSAPTRSASRCGRFGARASRRSPRPARWCRTNSASRSDNTGRRNRFRVSGRAIWSCDITRQIGSPPTIHVETPGGQPVQRFTLDATAPGLSFLMGNGPLLGLGEGGAQFDRRGSTDQMRNGQVDVRARRLPARDSRHARADSVAGRHRSGWGLFIHQPYGAFDFTGAEGRFTPNQATPGHADRVRLRRRSICSSSARAIRRRSCASTRASPACPRCRRAGRSATCSRAARSRARRRFSGSPRRSARRSCRATG